MDLTGVDKLKIQAYLYVRAAEIALQSPTKGLRATEDGVSYF